MRSEVPIAGEEEAPIPSFGRGGGVLRGGNGGNGGGNTRGEMRLPVVAVAAGVVVGGCSFHVNF